MAASKINFPVIKHIICLFILEIQVHIINLSVAIYYYIFIPQIRLMRLVFALFLILLIIEVILDNLVLITFIQNVNRTDQLFIFPKSIYVHLLDLILIFKYYTIHFYYILYYTL